MTSPPSTTPPLSGLKAVIVDEWALYRQGVASVLRNLGVDVIGEAASAADGMMRLWSGRPDLLVAGSPAHSRLPDLVAEAKKAYPELRVLAHEIVGRRSEGAISQIDLRGGSRLHASDDPGVLRGA